MKIVRPYMRMLTTGDVLFVRHRLASYTQEDIEPEGRQIDNLRRAR